MLVKSVSHVNRALCDTNLYVCTHLWALGCLSLHSNKTIVDGEDCCVPVTRQHVTPNGR